MRRTAGVGVRQNVKRVSAAAEMLSLMRGDFGTMKSGRRPAQLSCVLVRYAQKTCTKTPQSQRPRAEPGRELRKAHNAAIAGPALLPIFRTLFFTLCSVLSSLSVSLQALTSRCAVSALVLVNAGASPITFVPMPRSLGLMTPSSARRVEPREVLLSSVDAGSVSVDSSYIGKPLHS